MAQVFVYNFTHTSSTGAAMVATATSTGPMLFSGVSINTPGSSGNSFQVYSGTSTAATLICNIIGPSTGSAPYQMVYNVPCPTGIFFNNTGGVSPDVTVIWA